MSLLKFSSVSFRSVYCKGLHNIKGNHILQMTQKTFDVLETTKVLNYAVLYFKPENKIPFKRKAVLSSVVFSFPDRRRISYISSCQVKIINVGVRCIYCLAAVHKSTKHGDYQKHTQIY